MKLKEGIYVDDNFKVGDSAWACAYSFATNKETRLLYQEPIKGEFVAGKDEAQNTDLLQRYAAKGVAPSIGYFVPYKKDGVSLAWSKKIDAQSRMYATTRDECVELYNDKIDSHIRWHENQIDELRKMKI